MNEDIVKKEESKKDEPVPSEPQDMPIRVETELEARTRERDEYLAGWQRAKADFVNYRKEEGRRMEDMLRYDNEDMLRELITLLDHFDLAIASLEKHGPVEKGIYLMRTQLADLLKKKGLEKIEIKLGDPYNPQFAEAIAEAESKEYPPGAIIEEIEPGYKLHEKILRPARVRIAKEHENMKS